LHTLRADVELQKGRKLRLSLAYTIAQTLAVPATVDAATLQHSIDSMPPGALTVRPSPGQTSFAVSGDLTLSRGLVRLDHAAMSGAVEFDANSSGSSIVNSSALGFSIEGADDILVAGNTFDGQGRRNQNFVYDQPAGSVPDGFVIRDNLFRNFYIDSGDVHSEALYIGYSTNGLIENNTFTNNGNTSHIFFTWFGATADPATTYPRNMADSDCIVFEGSNMAECHPVAFRWPMKAKVEHGAKIIHVDPRFTRTSSVADIYAPVRAGSERMRSIVTSRCSSPMPRSSVWPVSWSTSSRSDGSAFTIL